MGAIYSAACVAVAATFASLVHASLDVTSNRNVAVYWGQGPNQDRLIEFCKSTTYDIINIAFVNVFPDQGPGGYPGTNFGNQCGDEVYDNVGIHTALLSNCDWIGHDISECQAYYQKTIMLSLGGGYPTNYYIEDDESAVNFADFLWGTFGPVTEGDYPRPFGDSVVDGFDFDIESLIDTSQAENTDVPSDYQSRGYGTMINHLKNNLFVQDDSKPYYISAAPQCLVPDAHLADAIMTSWFDFLFVQFFNTPGCSARDGVNAMSGGPSDISFDEWVSFVKTSALNKNIKIFMGLAASEVAANPGSYVAPSDAAKLVDKFMQKYPETFGGVMLWEATHALNNVINDKDYGDWIRAIVDGTYDGSEITSTRTVSSSSTIPTSSSTPVTITYSSTLSSTTSVTLSSASTLSSGATTDAIESPTGTTMAEATATESSSTTTETETGTADLSSVATLTSSTSSLPLSSSTESSSVLVTSTFASPSTVSSSATTDTVETPAGSTTAETTATESSSAAIETETSTADSSSASTSSTQSLNSSSSSSASFGSSSSQTSSPDASSSSPSSSLGQSTTISTSSTATSLSPTSIQTADTNTVTTTVATTASNIQSPSFPGSNSSTIASTASTAASSTISSSPLSSSSILPALSSNSSASTFISLPVSVAASSAISSSRLSSSSISPAVSSNSSASTFISLPASVAPSSSSNSTFTTSIPPTSSMPSSSSNFTTSFTASFTAPSNSSVPLSRSQPPASIISTIITVSPTPTSSVGSTSTLRCFRDNCFRALQRSSAAVNQFCATFTTAPSGTIPAFAASACTASNDASVASRVASACSCLGGSLSSSATISTGSLLGSSAALSAGASAQAETTLSSATSETFDQRVSSSASPGVSTQAIASPDSLTSSAQTTPSSRDSITSAQGPAATSSPENTTMGAQTAPLPLNATFTVMSTSTVYMTSVATVTRCPATLPSCQPESQTQEPTTLTIALYTTICPVTITQQSSSPQSISIPGSAAPSSGITSASEIEQPSAGTSSGYASVGNSPDSMSTPAYVGTSGETTLSVARAVTSIRSIRSVTSSVVVTSASASANSSTGSVLLAGTVSLSVVVTSAPGSAASSSGLTTSAVYSTALVTVTKCPASVTDCPAESQTTETITSEIAFSTAVGEVTSPSEGFQFSVPANATLLSYASLSVTDTSSRSQLSAAAPTLPSSVTPTPGGIAQPTGSVLPPWASYASYHVAASRWNHFHASRPNYAWWSAPGSGRSYSAAVSQITGSDTYITLTVPQVPAPPATLAGSAVESLQSLPTPSTLSVSQSSQPVGASVSASAASSLASPHVSSPASAYLLIPSTNPVMSLPPTYAAALLPSAAYPTETVTLSVIPVAKANDASLVEPGSGKAVHTGAASRLNVGVGLIAVVAAGAFAL